MAKRKPPPEDDLQQGGQGQSTQQPPASDDALGIAGLSAADVRATPEYRELQRQNRILAREAGSARQQAEAARTAAEAAAQAAEAQRLAAQEEQIRASLGDEGVAFWNEFADLSATDPVKAAQRLAEFTAKAQSQTGSQQQQQPDPQAGSQQVSQQQQPPATGLQASVGTVPIQGQADDTAETIAALEKRYADTVERNQNGATRNRVTMKERGTALISYLGAAYLKAGARPSNKS